MKERINIFVSDNDSSISSTTEIKVRSRDRSILNTCNAKTRFKIERRSDIFSLEIFKVVKKQ